LTVYVIIMTFYALINHNFFYVPEIGFMMPSEDGLITVQIIYLFKLNYLFV